MSLLENRGAIIIYLVVFFQICIGCNRQSDKAVNLSGDTIFLSYNEYLNYISIDSLYVKTPKGTLEKVNGGIITMNDKLVNFNYLGIYQCSGCEFLKLFFREENLIESFPPNMQEAILKSVTEENIKADLLPMVEIKIFDANLKIGKIEITDSTKVSLKRIILSL